MALCCKKIRPLKKVSQENIDKIVEAARFTPTSSGVQQFRVLVVSNQKIKEKLSPKVLNSEVMKKCSRVLVFAVSDQFTAERIDAIYKRTTKQRGLPSGKFKNYTDNLKETYLNEPMAENFIHTARQSYIGFAMALAQAAELKVK